MEEETILNMILTISKNMCEILFHGNIESSNKKVETTFNDALNSYLDIQKEIFEIMKEKNYYTLSTVSSTKIEDVKTKHEKCKA